ncbi:MAG: MBL fold metallo-hydrolase [Haliea sp.]|nr:MBL fold metallo-hydrolase [Haliea sp.]
MLNRLIVLVTLCIVLGPVSHAADDQLPTFFPNTEVLAADEMRITALGTGLPTPLTRVQKSTSWMVELGNGDVFLFDIGTGSMENLFGLRPDFSRIDKVFLSHLHTDHFGDLDAFYVGSWLSGRYTPLHVYGATGETPELGTRAAVEAVMKAVAWDTKSRTGILPDLGGKVVIHEFDYRKENQVVYEERGVKISSWPAIHSLDGSVSYRLEWNGLSFVFGGDTRPNRWFIKYAVDADFVIHECFPTPEGLARFNQWEMRPSTFVSSYIHTPPEGFGKVMSAVRPRMAVAYHTVLLPDIYQGMLEAIRKTYDGPLTIATDLTVWNVSKDKIVTRAAVFPDRVTPPPTTEAFKKAPRSGEAKMSDYIMDGVWEGFTPPPLPEN